MNRLTAIEVLLLQQLVARGTGGFTIREWALSLEGSGFQATIDAVKSSARKFVEMRFATYEKIADDWRYYATTRGAKRANG